MTNDLELMHNQRIGAWGEELACRFLTELEYRLLARNWRTGHLEVDIIADDCGEIVFIEVKTRTKEGYYTAKGAVNERKKRLLSQAAKIFMSMYYPELPYRFDIITVIGEGEHMEVKHYKRAYTKRRKHFVY